jgi:hypothetical protein
MTTYRLFPSTDGPASPAAYSGPFLAGVAFEVTTGGTWFEGYWWWVCPSGQSAAPQQFALWQVYTNATGTLIASAAVTSQALTPGQWNYVPLPAPAPLAIGVTYIAATGFSGSFPVTDNSFGASDQYSAGIVSGPLSAYSDSTGSHPAPFAVNQGAFSVAGTDPTQVMPAFGFDSDNFWMDVQVSDTAPDGASYRLWPNYPTPPNVVSIDTGAQTSGTEFRLSEPCTLDNIWFYSPPGVTVLPSRCGIWDVSTQAVAPNTDRTSPAWSGAAGSGWVSCAYSGVTLPAGDYKAAMFYGGSEKFYTEDVFYFSTGAGGNGIVAGPLSSPSVSQATSPGNSTYQDGAWAYPNTFDNKDNGENRWIDVEVTPGGGSPPPPPTADSGAFLVFFP